MSIEQATVEQRDPWPEGPAEPELPRRPRRRLPGVGGNPTQLALTGVLLIACGFIGGVLVEKGQSSSSSSGGGASGLASRFAAVRGAASGSSGGPGGGASPTGIGSGAAGSTGGAGLFGANGARGTGAGGLAATVGQVAYVSGSTLYVTTGEGNTVKVKTSDASTVSKTVKSDVKGIHPGETVIVTGGAGASGAIQAESIRVNEAGAGGGLGALFGGAPQGSAGLPGLGGASSGSSGASGTSGSGGEPALFGK
jgi:hypothetical protein